MFSPYILLGVLMLMSFWSSDEDTDQEYWHCPQCGEPYLFYIDDKISGSYEVRDNADVQNHRLIHTIEKSRGNNARSSTEQGLLSGVGD